MQSTSETLAGYAFFCLAVKATDDEEDDKASELLRNVSGPGVSSPYRFREGRKRYKYLLFV